MDREDLVDLYGEELIVLSETEYDTAIIGVAEVDGAWRVVYDRCALIEVLVENDKMGHDEALEYFNYNIARGADYVQDSPIFVDVLCDWRCSR